MYNKALVKLARLFPLISVEMCKGKFGRDDARAASVILKRTFTVVLLIA